LGGLAMEHADSLCVDERRFCVYYSIWALFSTYLQKELSWTPQMVAMPLFWANIVVFLGNSLWGVVDRGQGRSILASSTTKERSSAASSRLPSPILQSTRRWALRCR